MSYLIAMASSSDVDAGATRPRELSDTASPNALWWADFKDEFMLGYHKYCYPLTTIDYSSRYLLACEGLESTKSSFAFTVFERVFKDYGLPCAIRTDNGNPFASANALFGLSKLAVWWLRLGIGIKSRHQDIQTGTGKDALLLRTGLAVAAQPLLLNIDGDEVVPVRFTS